MNCIVVDDEPLAREAMAMLIERTDNLTLLNSFSGAKHAAQFLEENDVDLIFLDIEMPGTNGLEFSKTIPKQTLIVFTTAYSQYAVDSYDGYAIDYLVKPVKLSRFEQAVSKASFCFKLLKAGQFNQNIVSSENYFFVKAERRFFKVYFDDILFIEGLKDYVVLHTTEQKIVTAMNIKTIHAQMAQNVFVRISKSFIININKVTSFDNSRVYILDHEIPVGNVYRNHFFNEFVEKKLLGR
jgi:DNA-binding LytR/AlgR family response regulator